MRGIIFIALFSHGTSLKKPYSWCQSTDMLDSKNIIHPQKVCIKPIELSNNVFSHSSKCYFSYHDLDYLLLCNQYILL